MHHVRWRYFCGAIALQTNLLLNLKITIDRVVSSKVTVDEHQELETMAKSEGKALSEWSREVLLREARSPRLNALFTEIVATRMLLNLVLKPIVCGEKMTAEEFSNVLTKVRTTKYTGAKDLMEQYTVPQQKEYGAGLDGSHEPL
jgi:hypothetical protein